MVICYRTNAFIFIINQVTISIVIIIIQGSVFICEIAEFIVGWRDVTGMPLAVVCKWRLLSFTV